MHVFVLLLFFVFLVGFETTQNEKNKIKKIITKRGGENKTKQNKTKQTHKRGRMKNCQSKPNFKHLSNLPFCL
jgi:hypothetical protein